MPISLSMPHALFGAHPRLAKEHNELVAQIDKLIPKLQQAKKEADEETREALRSIKALISRGKEITKQIQTANPDKRSKLQQQLKKMQQQIFKIQTRHTSNDKAYQLRKKLADLKNLREAKKDEHDAARGLLALYAIRRWND